MIKYYRFRFIPLLLSMIFAIICFITLAGEALPFLDPTPEMMNDQTERIHLWKAMTIVSLCAIALSCVLLYYFKRYKKNRHD